MGIDRETLMQDVAGIAIESYQLETIANHGLESNTPLKPMQPDGSYARSPSIADDVIAKHQTQKPEPAYKLESPRLDSDASYNPEPS